MIKKKLSEIAAMVSGEINEKYEDVVVQGVTTDSRNASLNNLFVPLKDVRNGHEFVEDAFQNGVAASFWENGYPNPPQNRPLIFVEDALEALQILAEKYLETMSAVVIAITGSNGKTSTKDMTAAVLSQTFSVHKTVGNFNNHIGLPLTILSAPHDIEVLILEMGMSAKGEISFLSNLAKPHIAIITNIGESHMLNLGSREGIADAKCEIIEGLNDEGVLFYNGDEILLQDRLSSLARKQSFGFDDSNDFYPIQVTTSLEKTTFTIFNQEFVLPIPGEHNVVNAIAAIAIGCEFNMSWQEIAEGINNVELTGMRLEVVEGAAGEKLVNDSYNASPTSMRAAVQFIHDLQGYDRKIVVLGDMLELGDKEVYFHREIGELLKPLEIVYVFAYGPLAENIAKAASANFEAGRVFHFTDKTQLIEAVKKIRKPGDVILVKASRGMGLEKVVHDLEKD
ncbi:MAG: UDP-N-acetylmuramoyl-tripeptide--D-alanyl-D-alanine ligase [Bacillales bacterium]|jgi:UDP-N-acetylmuramoyl-tripeptide--D-alanyl-D-alanine ligase|nr:UDP-N-acetylmuramoyl-tripeptide--D-alanyl-D-alanine ligase [Bacillales bacterium]